MYEQGMQNDWGMGRKLLQLDRAVDVSEFE